MKHLLVLVVAALVGALTFHLLTDEPAVRPDANGPALTDAVAQLRNQVAELTRRLDAIEHAPALIVPERGNAAALEPRSSAPTADPERRDPHWYLEQYVLSFAVDAQGSEYFRLAVEAYVVELAAPIAAVVRDGSRPTPLRIALVNMLGKRRFDETMDVQDALLAAVRPPAPEVLALRALEALARIGSVSILPGLEAAFPLLRETSVRERALSLLAEVAGDATNEILLRLWASAADDSVRAALVARLNGVDAQAALALLRGASTGEPPVRLAAAKRVFDYDEPEFETFVAQWRPIETDAQVIAVLGGSATKDTPGWSAKQATGAPDADATRDDPKAWAPQSPQMGMQWLQLSYTTPTRANGVRIYEVNAPGAVAEVQVRAAEGAWSTVWRGTANGAGQPLLIQFPLTAFAVKSVKLVLDTNRAQGWNEIDAVELLGPGGAQWAARASCSSTYATTQAASNVNAQFSNDGVLLQTRRRL